MAPITSRKLPSALEESQKGICIRAEKVTTSPGLRIYFCPGKDERDADSPSLRHHLREIALRSGFLKDPGTGLGFQHPCRRSRSWTIECPCLRKQQVTKAHASQLASFLLKLAHETDSMLPRFELGWRIHERKSKRNVDRISIVRSDTVRNSNIVDAGATFCPALTVPQARTKEPLSMFLGTRLNHNACSDDVSGQCFS